MRNWDFSQLAFGNLSGLHFVVIFLVIGLIFLTISRRLLRYGSFYVFIGIVGLLVGLLLGELLADPMSRLPGPWGKWMPLVVTIVVTATSLDFFLGQANSWNNFFNVLLSHLLNRPKKVAPVSEIVVDSSVFIDGRIEEIVKTGFILGKLIIPRFVIDELQRISDSQDPIKRARGRRGLEILLNLSKSPLVETEVVETDFKEPVVDKKLIRLAETRGARLLTGDYNLNRVAEISGVRVLNINELANALRPLVLPGESLRVKVVALGKEKDQGVGYLPDGTMIVVEGGQRLVGEEIDCVVERIYQSVAGKMIFVKPKGIRGDR